MNKQWNELLTAIKNQWCWIRPSKYWNTENVVIIKKKFTWQYSTEYRLFAQQELKIQLVFVWTTNEEKQMLDNYKAGGKNAE